MRRGFTLIELMVVVAIIGILASIAVPDFLRFQCRSKQVEGRTNVRAMATLQEGFRAEQDRYACINDNSCPAADQLNFSAQGVGRYAYYSAPTGGQTFYGEASGVDGAVIGDLWTITQANDVTHAADACR